MTRRTQTPAKASAIPTGEVRELDKTVGTLFGITNDGCGTHVAFVKILRNYPLAMHRTPHVALPARRCGVIVQWRLTGVVASGVVASADDVHQMLYPSPETDWRGGGSVAEGDKKPFVFVVMQFSPEWNDVYEVGIRPACTDAGADCQRVDEQIFLENMLERIYRQIEDADIVVAEMSGRNPNVYYEVGYSHGVRKPVILLTREAEDIPFDLRQYPHIVYGNSIATLKRELERKVRWSVENTQSALPRGWSVPQLNESSFERAGAHILNYLRAKKFPKASFAKVRQNINNAYTDEFLLAMIDAAPNRWRRARMEGGRPGVALVSESSSGDDVE